jgi:hypothetical protein
MEAHVAPRHLQVLAGEGVLFYAMRQACAFRGIVIACSAGVIARSEAPSSGVRAKAGRGQ